MPRPAAQIVARLAVLILLPALAASSGAAAAEREVVVGPAAKAVSFTLDSTFHMVHGTMTVTGGTIRFDPDTGAARGTITVDARSAETGNGKRDRTMHAEVLESERHPTIGFRVDRVEGRLVDPGHSKLRLVGVLTLHGADHPMTLAASVDSAGGTVRGELRFTIPYVEWGMKDPSFLFVRAAKTVDVTARIEGRWADAGAASSRTGDPRPAAVTR
jgi:polyisoprenoid-binding protein YceI